MQGGVLDLCVADHIWVAPWNYLCYLYPHQANNPLFLRRRRWGYYLMPGPAVADWVSSEIISYTTFILFLEKFVFSFSGLRLRLVVCLYVLRVCGAKF
ncbi:hypothetical protein RHMOL_Rhmol11G0166100 [Rhododendron molle]|uniref:Uncharacterized protein n=1 Tax=Rhododendron molle TaxID=49168 RepID=A0ACC0LT78_RHOML|nr:hypothetical protein RHMOL_Rhmol11G0166100 [Rhododendron molle]